MKLAGNETRVKQNSCEYELLVERPRLHCSIYEHGLSRNKMNWIYPAQERYQWWALVNKFMNLGTSIKTGQLLAFQEGTCSLKLIS
jgi:hypothetical protein